VNIDATILNALLALIIAHWG